MFLSWDQSVTRWSKFKPVVTFSYRMKLFPNHHSTNSRLLFKVFIVLPLISNKYWATYHKDSSLCAWHLHCAANDASSNMVTQKIWCPSSKSLPPTWHGCPWMFTKYQSIHLFIYFKDTRWINCFPMFFTIVKWNFMCLNLYQLETLMFHITNATIGTKRFTTNFIMIVKKCH